MFRIPKQEYTAEFKEGAVQRVSGGEGIRAVAKDLGLVEQTLRTRRNGWRVRRVIAAAARLGAVAPATGFALAVAFAALAPGQAAAQDAAGRAEAVQRGQQRTGAAYRALQQARREASRAEQEFLEAQAAYDATRAQADEAKRRLESAAKARDAARASEARAGRDYDAALDRVDRARQAPPGK